MSLVSTAVANMLEKVRAAAGFDALYSTGLSQAFQVRVVKGKMPPQLKNQFDLQNIAYGQFMEIAVSALLENGQRFLPVRGHTITLGAQVWEVLDRPDLGRPWEYIDSGETTVRIYTLEASR